MNIENLRLTRNILLRSAVICYAFLLLSALMWLPFADTWTNLTTSMYHVTPEHVHNLIIDYLSIAKFFSIFFLLVPGLAIHWTIKRESSVKQNGSSVSISGQGVPHAGA
jgi:hypothetical protein